jgi:sugar transferase (PEP-CTERM/EpsH1 system associated)
VTAGAPPLVAHVVYRFATGGLENGIVNLVNRMPPERWRHVVVALTDVSQSFAARVQRADVRLIALEKRPGHLLSEYPRLYRLFKELRPTVVHSRNLAALEAVVPAWAAGVPVRIHGEHGWDIGDLQGQRSRYRYVRRIYRPFVTHYVALSRQLKDYLEQQAGIPPDRISQLYNGVDTRRYQPGQGLRPPIPGCPFRDPDHYLIGTVGRMEEVKDPLNLAKAFLRVLDLEPAAAMRLRLVMAGTGRLRGEVQAVLDKAGHGERVWLPGDRADVPAVMRGLDCFVLPSLAEGISNTILEAMASAVPIIATRVGGNAELIESGMTGTLVPSANSEALARAILVYVNDPATARRHAKAARHVAVTRFDLDRMVTGYAELYSGALRCAGIALPAQPAGAAVQS